MKTRKKDAFVQQPFANVGPSAATTHKGGRKPGHLPGEDPAVPHVKRFQDGYRVWNPIVRGYVGNERMQPFDDVGAASDLVRSLYVEMAKAGVGGKKVREKAESMIERGPDLLGAAPTARPPVGEQVGFKFNGAAKMSFPATIVIAWAMSERVWDGEPYRADLGERPGLVDVVTPRAAVWLNSGSRADFEKAKAYAAEEGEGRVVFVYPENEPDPIGRAKRDVVSMTKRATTRRKRNAYLGDDRVRFARQEMDRPWSPTHHVSWGGAGMTVMESVDLAKRRHYFTRDTWDQASNIGDFVVVGRRIMRPDLSDDPSRWKAAGSHTRIETLAAYQKRIAWPGDAKPNPFIVEDRRGRAVLDAEFPTRRDAGLARRYLEQSEGARGLRVRGTQLPRKRNNAAVPPWLDRDSGWYLNAESEVRFIDFPAVEAMRRAERSGDPKRIEKAERRYDALRATFDHRVAVLAREKYTLDAERGAMGASLDVLARFPAQPASAAAKGRKHNGSDYPAMFDAMAAQYKYLRARLGAAIKNLPDVTAVVRKDLQGEKTQFTVSSRHGNLYVMLAPRYSSSTPRAHVEASVFRIGGETKSRAVPNDIANPVALRSIVNMVAPELGDARKSNAARDEMPIGRFVTAEEARRAFSRDPHVEDAGAGRKGRRRDDDEDYKFSYKPNGAMAMYAR